MSTSQEQRKNEYRVSLQRQADFLLALAASVRHYNDSDGPKIDMTWLWNDLIVAAAECRNEAENQEL